MEQYGTIFTKMKTKILLTIIATILLAGLLIAGGVTLIERTVDLTPQQRTNLNQTGITNVNVENLRCYDTYCVFWITGKGIQSEVRLERYGVNCVANKSYNESDPNSNSQICSNVLKSDASLISERNAYVDNLLKTISSRVESARSNISIAVVGDKERVIIN